MVSKSTIKAHDFNDIQEYFEYIIDSRINGNKQQCKNFYNKLSASQKIDFMNWFNTFFYYDALDNETTAQNQYIEFINYINN